MRLSPILSLYICRHFVMAFFGALGVIMGLIFLFDVIELMRRTATHSDIGFNVILEMALFKLPQMVQLILPFAVMIGAMTAFWTMTRSRELVVTRSVGVSAWEILTPVLIVVLIIGVVNVTAFNPLAATLYKRYERLQDQMLLRGGAASPLQVGENGLWLRESHGDEQVVVHANAVRQEGYDLRLREVSVYVSSAGENFLYGIEASLGQLDKGFFHLTEVSILRPGRPVEFVPTYDFATQLTLGKIQDNFASPETISFWELPGFISFFESAGFSANRQKLYFQSLLSSPLLLMAMVLVAAVFSLKPNLRSGGILARLVGGVVSGFVFYFFSKVVYALGLSASLPVVLSAWTPPIVTGLVGLGALFHLEDG
ncbi:LPS export ABC transporter permease LptG [Telmatospirillum sp.]|uniref:LPS export ABC transporter permease LptG n=1 Tax=Telmatospirillum sp. TaxID=2079197 RepID=UPI00284A07F7|nr:LPS export ABC transporter permease LptG [Telmatospirillum sp.]MDR3435879.1 LPS export ABC transporter permease LptG [Telmatospirillum sp.]